jgi:hypothetical protein
MVTRQGATGTTYLRELLQSNINEVAEARVLAPNSDVLFAKELSNLLINLEAVSHEYGMEIASVLAGMASKNIIRKVEKSLRTKRRRWSSSRKLHNSCLIDGCHSTCWVRSVDLLSGVVLYVSVCSCLLLVGRSFGCSFVILLYRFSLSFPLINWAFSSF